MRPNEDPQELERALGWDRLAWTDPDERQQLRSYIALQLASYGLLPDEDSHEFALAQFSRGLLENWRKRRGFFRSSIHRWTRESNRS